MTKGYTVGTKIPVGRPSKYKPDYCQSIIDFFSVPLPTETPKDGELPPPLPTIIRFCQSIGIHKDTMHEWVKQHPEFSDAYKTAKDLQEQYWMQCSLLGLYKSPFTIFAGKNMFGWRDVREIEGKITIEDAINEIEGG